MPMFPEHVLPMLEEDGRKQRVPLINVLRLAIAGLPIESLRDYDLPESSAEWSMDDIEKIQTILHDEHAGDPEYENAVAMIELGKRIAHQIGPNYPLNAGHFAYLVQEYARQLHITDGNVIRELLRSFAEEAGHASMEFFQSDDKYTEDAERDDVDAVTMRVIDHVRSYMEASVFSDDEPTRPSSH